MEKRKTVAKEKEPYASKFSKTEITSAFSVFLFLIHDKTFEKQKDMFRLDKTKLRFSRLPCLQAATVPIRATGLLKHGSCLWFSAVLAATC